MLFSTKDSGTVLGTQMIRLLCLTAFLILCVFAFYFYEFDGGLSASQDKWGQFGDFIGGTLNPLISFAAFIAVIESIKLQQKIQKDSEKQFKQERFEATFFQMLTLFNEVLKNMEFCKGEECIKGKGCLDKIRDCIDCDLSDIPLENKQPFNELTHFLSHYYYDHPTYRNFLNQYFLNLSNIIKLVDKQIFLTDEDKFFYCEIIRNQFTETELVMLFYHCCMESKGYKNVLLKPLVKKYHFLNGLQPHFLFKEEHYYDWKSIFEDGMILPP